MVRVIIGGNLEKLDPVFAQFFKGANLRLCHRSPHGGNHIAEAILMGGDDVDVAFHNYGQFLLADCLGGNVQAIDGGAFVEGLSLR